MRRLPPLTALRAFEAAGRHLSFSQAADELNLTPSAISHQIKHLEAHLGVALFRRMHKRLSLTPAGEIYLQPLTECFDRIETATARVAEGAGSGALNVSLTPTFALRWLVPRLAGFQARHPDLEVRLSMNQALVDFRRDNVDMAIRYGNGNWPGLVAVLVLREDLVPVCSPALAAGDHPLQVPDDLRHFTLLHDLYRPDEWRMWLTAAGAPGVDPTRGLKFNSTTLALEAAIEGLGVAIVNPALIERDRKAGRLIVPIDFQLPLASGHYIVYPEEHRHDPRIQAFQNWLLDEMPSLEAAPPAGGDAGAEP